MLLTTYQFRNMIEKPGEEIISNYPADTLYFHGTPMGRILTDLLSIPCWPAIAWETPFIRVIRVLFLKAGSLRFKVTGGELDVVR